MAASDNLFVGDLPANVTDQLVKDVFAAYGTVTSCKAIPPKPGQTRGAALVRFSSVEEATWVQENLNGNLAEGLEHPIVVQFSRSAGAGKGDATPHSAAWGPPAVSSTFGGESVSDNLFIGDLPPDINEMMLKDIFSSYGTVLSCKAVAPKPGGEKGAGLVRFSTTEEAQWVKDNLHGNIPEGLATPVIVHFARSSGVKGEGPAPKGKGAGGSWGPAAQSWSATPRVVPYPPAAAKGAKGGGKGPSEADFHSFLFGLASSGVLQRGKRPDEQCVHIKNLPMDTTDQNLYELFSCFGAIAFKGVKAMLREDGACSGVGFVDFMDAATANAAAEALNGQVLPDGRVLGVNVKVKRKGAGKGAS